MAALSWMDFINGEILSSVRSKINNFGNDVVTNVNINTTNIATNTADIATNVTDIATNASGIVTNAAGIVTNGSNIATNITDITALDVRVTANEVEITHLEDTGMTVRVGSNITPQTIAITATKVISFDTTVVEAGNGTEWDTVNLRMKATSDGIFKLRYESFISYASNIDITWQIYKNGGPFGSSITLSGQGATIFPLVLLSSTSLLANDYLELHATASSSTALTVVQANGTLEKTHFGH